MSLPPSPAVPDTSSRPCGARPMAIHTPLAYLQPAPPSAPPSTLSSAYSPPRYGQSSSRAEPEIPSRASDLYRMYKPRPDPLSLPAPLPAHPATSPALPLARRAPEQDQAMEVDPPLHLAPSTPHANAAGHHHAAASSSSSSSMPRMQTPPMHPSSLLPSAMQPQQPPAQVDHGSVPFGLFDHPYDFGHLGHGTVHAAPARQTISAAETNDQVPSPAMSLPTWLSGVDTPFPSLQPQRAGSSASHASANPSVPPPRRFRFSEPDENERLTGISRAPRDQRAAVDRERDTAAATAVHVHHAHQRSQQSQQRLSLLDRIRLNDASNGATDAQSWNAWGSPSGGAWGSVAPLRGPDTSTRLDRYPLGEPSPRDARSRPTRRPASSSSEMLIDPLSTESDEGRPEIIRWHNDIQEAISRRSSDERDAPQSPLSSLRRHREITWSTTHERPRSRQRLDDADSRPSLSATDNNGHGSHSRPWATWLWGELGSAEFEEARREETALEQWYATHYQTHHHPSHHRSHAVSTGSSPRSVSTQAQNSVPVQAPATGSSPVTPYIPYGLPSGSLQRLPSVAAHTPDAFKSIIFTPDMTDAERLKKIMGVARTVQYWPSRARKVAAESTLKQVTWGKMAVDGEMARDACCSVCHDDYEGDSKVSVTACKHMYHRQCLQTWLDRPHTSSCPMCRRDLAILASVYKMMPGEVDAAIPLWMAL